MNTKEYRTSLANAFLNLLQEEQLEWKKGWNGWGKNTPMNGETKYKYKGINRFHLMLVSMMRGYEDPRWCTYTQIQKEGWKLVDAKGQGVKVEYWFPYDTEEKKGLSWQEFRERKESLGERYTLRAVYKTVFNAALIEGIPQLPEPEQNDILPDVLIDTLSNGMNVPILNDGGDRAFYRPSEDKIHLPMPEFFYSDYEYASTALHELAHATGAAHRLNRKMGSRGGEDYAFEELIAEISSCFMSVNLQTEQNEQHVKNHKAYVQSWIQVIQKTPETLVKAVQEAEKAASYMEYKAGILKREEYEMLMASSKETVVENREKQKSVSLEDRYTKAMKLAGYERVKEPLDSLATVAFYNHVSEDMIRVDGWEALGSVLENLKPMSQNDEAEYEDSIHPKGRLVFYTKNLGGTGLGEDQNVKTYPDFESALVAYAETLTDGKKLGYLLNGEEYQLVSFDTVSMKHTYVERSIFPELAQNEVEEILRLQPSMKNTLNKDQAYHSLNRALDIISMQANSELLKNKAEWGSWIGRAANVKRPQDYIDIDITGYSTWHEVIYTVLVVHANEIEESKSFSIKTDGVDFEQNLRKGFQEAKNYFQTYFKEALDKLDTDFEKPMRIYSPYTEHTLVEHYEQLQQNGYAIIPEYQRTDIEELQNDEEQQMEKEKHNVPKHTTPRI